MNFKIIFEQHTLAKQLWGKKLIWIIYERTVSDSVDAVFSHNKQYIRLTLFFYVIRSTLTWRLLERSNPYRPLPWLLSNFGDVYLSYLLQNYRRSARKKIEIHVNIQNQIVFFFSETQINIEKHSWIISMIVCFGAAQWHHMSVFCANSII